MDKYEIWRSGFFSGNTLNPVALVSIEKANSFKEAVIAYTTRHYTERYLDLTTLNIQSIYFCEDIVEAYQRTWQNKQNHPRSDYQIPGAND